MDLERHISGRFVPVFTDDQKRVIVADYLFSKDRMDVVAERHGCSRGAISNWVRKFGFQARRPASWQTGNANLWKNGTRVTQQGYIQIHKRHEDVPEQFYCMAAKTGYIMLHRLVVARHLGRPLRSEEQVHHKDGDRKNNDIGNLQLRIGNHGTGSVFLCADCGSLNVVAG